MWPQENPANLIKTSRDIWAGFIEKYHRIYEVIDAAAREVYERTGYEGKSAERDAEVEAADRILSRVDPMVSELNCFCISYSKRRDQG